MTPSAAACTTTDDGRRTLAPPARRRVTVLERRELGSYVVLRCADPGGPPPRPGQFAMLAAAERWGGGDGERPFLPRAFSVLRAAAGELEFMLEDVGPGTSRLCELEAGEELWLLGPLGIGFDLAPVGAAPGGGAGTLVPDARHDDDAGSDAGGASAPPAARRPLLVGGGVGTAPLGLLQDELRAGGVQTTTLLGFRDAAHAEGAALLHDARVATDDGAVGHRGRVTELLVEELDRLDEPQQPQVYACGPPPMLEAVRALCAARDVPAQLALESGMACGFGACFGCVVPTHDGYVRLCVDGPVLDAARLETALVPGAGH